MKSSRRSKFRAPHRLRLPELEQCRTAVLNSLVSAESRRSYKFGTTEFIQWYCSEPRLAFNRVVVLRYRQYLESRSLAPATINVRLAAVRRLAYEAADSGLLSPELVAGIRRVKGAKRLGVRTGNWLSLEQTQKLLNSTARCSLRDRRDNAILALLLGCGLRRSELVALEFEHIQTRDEHWVILDLVGKGRHVRTVPVPEWVKAAIDCWTSAARITSGHLFRPIRRSGAVMTRKLTPNVVWYVVGRLAARSEIGRLAPHDLRRTCARLCHAAGGELEQIQFLLGHASVQTTERYIGCKQRLAWAVNDRIQPSEPGVQPLNEQSIVDSRGMYIRSDETIHNQGSGEDDRRKLPDVASLVVQQTVGRT
jgi:integrase